MHLNARNICGRELSRLNSVFWFVIVDRLDARSIPPRIDDELATAATADCRLGSSSAINSVSSGIARSAFEVVLAEYLREATVSRLTSDFL